MLIRGREFVTHNGIMLDEVLSLLQKSLRRQELDLSYRAAKELVGYDKDQLPWKSLVTFMFEDHCLTDVATLEMYYDIIIRKNKYQAVELLGKCFTCRYAACLRVVALGEEYWPNAELWNDTVTLEPEFQTMVAKSCDGIDCDILIALIIKYWKDQNTKALTTLFALVSVAAIVENRSITGKGINYLIDNSVKTPTLYHLVISILYKTATDEYMKKYARLCYHFAAIDYAPYSLILFCTVSQMIFKEKVLSHVKPDLSNIGAVDWDGVPKIEHMPSWAVDINTYRGRFGKETMKFRNSPLPQEDRAEFHGSRPKADIRMYFDDGCVCINDILNENPIFEEAKQMYLKQTPSMQNTKSMTRALHYELKQRNSICFGKHTDVVDDSKAERDIKRRLTSSLVDEPGCCGQTVQKQAKLVVSASVVEKKESPETK